MKLPTLGQMLSVAVAGYLCIAMCAGQVSTSAYVNFESAQVHPVRLSSDGSRLFAVDTPDARVSVFDVSVPASPRLIAEIPVGIEPVSVNSRSNDEVWVVNQVSDSISVVSVSKGIVTDTIYVKDEPADLVFLGTQAFVSVAGSNQIRVFDASTHALVKSIDVFCQHPRALATSASNVYAACALSGNRTTLIPFNLAPPQPPPTNPLLPPPPQVGLIVDATDPAWTSVIRYTMPDNDVVEIDGGTLAVTRYFSGVGTNNLGIALRPGTGDIYVANTDALNLIHFETNLRGHWNNNRITRILTSGQIRAFDLNPSVNYSILPNPAALAVALAQPTAVEFNSNGQLMYVAAFGTDRVAAVDPNGNVTGRVEIGPATGSTVDPANKRGPRGLAVNSTASLLYVLNRISNTISIVDTTKLTVLSEISVGSFDPTPTVIRGGRGFLFDAKLSGNGTGACASCHVDAEMDHLAWDLGDPSGTMTTVVSRGVTFHLHPMKGPMFTQTLRGLNGLSPYHWRGDKPDFAAFNAAFDKLMGGPQIATGQMDAYTNFINTIQFAPNPYLHLDGTLPATIAGGDPTAGETLFKTDVFRTNTTCTTCHPDPGPGTDRSIRQQGTVIQPMKVPHLRNMYQKVFFNNTAGAQTIDGFGFRNDGGTPSIFHLLGDHFFGTVSTNSTVKTNLQAYNLCFDTGTVPAVGYTRTVTRSNVKNSAVLNDWTTLEQQALAASIDLIAKGTINGQVHGLLYRPLTQDYETDKTGLGPLTKAQLIADIGTGDVLSVMGVPTGSGVRMGIDRELDGKLDGDP